jgi:NAD(P)-dependent dehydrogenase (short-subunit alcohol dehydrogenase family)
VNVTAPMLLTKACAPRMTGERGGVIVNVSSPVAHVGAKKASYAASKAALHGLTMSSAKALGSKNIRVNTLLPGPTITKMTEDWSEARRASVAQESFLGRLSEPEEVAEMICCLLSDEARYMTGAIVDLTAGSLWGG